MEIKKRIVFLLLFGLCNILVAKHLPSTALVINEIKTHGLNAPNDEFIEFFNVSDSSISVGGYKLMLFKYDGRLMDILFTFPDSMTIKPYQYFLLCSDNCTENKVPDALFSRPLLSNSQLMLTDSTGQDTIDAVSWGNIEINVSNEGEPVPFLEPTGGPPVSPELLNSPLYVIHRVVEGVDTNQNQKDFVVYSFTTPMNMNDTLTLILANSFRVTLNSQQNLALKWSTIHNTRNMNFDIFIKDGSLVEYKIIQTEDALLHTSQNDTNMFEYAFTNIDMEKTYSMKIREIDFRNQESFSETITVIPKTLTAPEKVATFKLLQNHPNPFNPETKIKYAIFERTEVTLTIYNIYGQKIKNITTGWKAPGEYLVTWNGTNESQKKVASGEYFATLKTHEHAQQTIKMLFLK